MRLDNVWGVGGGLRPVKYLIKQIVLLLKEYLCSGDIGEASRCLRELEVPHFHHELVYEVSINQQDFLIYIFGTLFSVDFYSRQLFVHQVWDISVQYSLVESLSKFGPFGAGRSVPGR